LSSFTLGFRKVGRVEQRRDKRLLAPVFAVKVDGQSCETINWSLGGVLVRNHRGYLPPGRQVTIEISEKRTPSQRDSQRLSRLPGESAVVIEGEVVHCNATKHQLAVKFIRLSPVVLKFLERNVIAYRQRL
jgi:hypothetical protein